MSPTDLHGAHGVQPHSFQKCVLFLQVNSFPPNRVSRPRPSKNRCHLFPQRCPPSGTWLFPRLAQEPNMKNPSVRNENQRIPKWLFGQVVFWRPGGPRPNNHTLSRNKCLFGLGTRCRHVIVLALVPDASKKTLGQKSTSESL